MAHTERAKAEEEATFERIGVSLSIAEIESPSITRRISLRAAPVSPTG
jgi:hypothetical protein